jgi:hypothetical protein
MFVEQLKIIDEYYSRTADRLKAVSELLKSCKNLQHRCSCPECYREFSSDERKQLANELPILQARYDELSAKVNKEWEDSEPAREEARKKYVKELEATRRSVDEYVETHKTAFKKVIHNFRYNEPIGLPDISVDEQKLWNKAIEEFVGNSKAYDDITFNIDEIQYDLG